MNIHLVQVDIKEKGTLGNLIKEYQKEILGLKKVEEYKYLDSYWQEPERHPYYIKVDDTTVGFVLVNNFSLIEKGARSISEFYIKKEFRNKGIGKLTAFKVFDLFRGKWEIRELSDNAQAQNFWRKVIYEYTHNNYLETLLDNENWRGPVQVFDNS